jgi:type I restriction enzyme, R subunit
VLADVAERGIGRRYLIQHSAGSGKSNSIAWLALQLIGLWVVMGSWFLIPSL